MNKGSELEIAKRNNISTNSVNRILHDISQKIMVSCLPLLALTNFPPPKIQLVEWLLLL